MTDQTQPLTPAPEGNPPGSGYLSGVGEGNVTWHPGEYPPEPAATVPVPAVTEDTVTFRAVPAPAVYATFGDMLAATMPGFDIWPCGRCGTAFEGYPANLLDHDRVLRLLMHLARVAGWAADSWGVWACASCLSAERNAAAEAARAWAGACQPDAYPDLIGEYDDAAAAMMERLGGKWYPRRWRYEEPAAEGSWAA